MMTSLCNYAVPLEKAILCGLRHDATMSSHSLKIVGMGKGFGPLTSVFGGQLRRGEHGIFEKPQAFRGGEICVSTGSLFERRSPIAPENVQKAALSDDVWPTESIASDERMEEKEQPQLHLNVEQFFLPELRCQFPAKNHPDYAEIRAEIEPWLLEWKRPRTEEEKEFLLESDLPGVVCWTIPESTYKHRMLLLAKLITWICCFDDASDEAQQMGADSTAVNEINEHIKRVLEGRDSNEAIDRPEIQAVSSVLRQMRADMSPHLHRLHADTLSRGLFTFETQADLREKHALPDLSTYISTRRKTFGFSHIQVMMQYCLGVELEEETLQMECMQELHNAVADYVAWTNDLLSFRREYFQGDLQNLPSIVYFHHGGKLGFQAAVNQVCEMIGARERDFTRIFNEILQSDLPARKPGLRTYLRNLPFVLSGHLHWYYTSARFHGVGHSMAECREGILHMNPQKTVLLPIRTLPRP